MNPESAVQKLIANGWPVARIALEVGMHRANVYKVGNGEQTPSYDNAIKLIALARSGRKPPKERAA